MRRALLLLAAACSSPPAKPAAPEPTTCAHAPSWRFERIELPPEFAPELPRGVERLYFSPQMFEPGTPGYFSYVFSLELEDPAPAGAGAVEALLERYYSGLIAAVAASKKLPAPPPARVEVEAAGSGRYRARVETIDAFTGGDPISIGLDIHAAPRCLSVAASAADVGAPIWTELERARRCVSCE